MWMSLNNFLSYDRLPKMCMSFGVEGIGQDERLCFSTSINKLIFELRECITDSKNKIITVVCLTCCYYIT